MGNVVEYPSTISLFNAVGQLVYEEKNVAPSTNITITGNDFSNGVYFLKIRTIAGLTIHSNKFMLYH